MLSQQAQVLPGNYRAMTENQLTQAEIAGGIFKTAETCPVKGQLMRDFELVSTEGAKISVSDYRGRSNLVLVFAGGDSQSLELLTRIANSYRKIQEEQTEVLAVVQCSNEKAAGSKMRRGRSFQCSLIETDGYTVLWVHKIEEVKLKWQCTSQIALAKCLPRSVSQKSKRCLECRRFSNG